MTVPFRSIAGASALALALCATSCNSTPTPQMSEAEMTAKWTEFATPSQGHKALTPKVGRWDLKIKQYMAAGAAPQESTGHSEMKWAMDGRYVEDNTESKSPYGQFTGHGVLGYDNLKHKYVGTWYDNMGTGITSMEGTYDPSTKTFSYACTMPDFANGKYAASRSTERMIDNDHWTMQMWGPGLDGKEYLCMEIEYTRAK